MKVLIVDDEHLARERLKSLVGRLPAYECVGEAATAEEALEMLEQDPADIVLLDIRLPGDSGLSLARRLAQQSLAPAIIFTTAHSEHALSAFDTDACAYLLKPIKREKLAAALDKAARTTRAQQDNLFPAHRESQAQREHIVATTREGQQRIPVSEVIYFEADQKYTTVFHRHGEVLIEESLRHLETDLAPDFLRIHRKFLVNTRFISSLERGEPNSAHGAELRLRHTEQTLPVSRRRLAEVRRLLFKGH